MISKNDNFSSLIIEIKKELKSKHNIYQHGVNVKLKRSIKNYKREIELNVEYINSRTNYSTMKALKRFLKREGTSIDEEGNNWGFVEID